jgi:hypothetical protein
MNIPGMLRVLAKRSLPATIQRALVAIEDGVQMRIYRPGHFKYWLRDCGMRRPKAANGELDRHVYVRAMIDWLKEAQDVVEGGGVAAFYDFKDGWSAGYPETTGYIIVTSLEAAERLGDADLRSRARRMADWEVDIQLPDGAWQGGVVTAPRVPSVFNTGQVMQGLVAASIVLNQPDYLRAASRAGHWLVKHQEADGAWRSLTYNNFPNTYSTRVAWPMLQLADANGERSVREAALRYLEWVAQYQDESGWFNQCTLEVDTPPLTHTLAYTIEGLIESGVLLKDDRWVVMGQRPADLLLRRFELRGRLAGTFTKGWKPDNSFSCITGCAQMSLIWSRLFEITGDVRYVNAALKMNDYVLGLVDLHAQCLGIRGGVKGSDPIWGPYMSYRMPSWAVKFTLDALFREADTVRRIEGNCE